MSTMSQEQLIDWAAKKPTPRMSGTQRRAEILVAARKVFAERGYAASTDEVARAAGVSQPYVVRLFGTKRELFLAAYSEASAQAGSPWSGRGRAPSRTRCRWRRRT